MKRLRVSVPEGLPRAVKFRALFCGAGGLDVGRRATRGLGGLDGGFELARFRQGSIERAQRQVTLPRAAVVGTVHSAARELERARTVPNRVDDYKRADPRVRPPIGQLNAGSLLRSRRRSRQCRRDVLEDRLNTRAG